jgi:PIN domain nuclease of toxin-antitoxin system
MIIAQAKAEDYIIITNDDRFKLYDVKLVWFERDFTFNFNF